MNTYKKAAYFLAFLLLFSVSLPAEAAVDNSRYLIKTDKAFWKKSFGVRHEFESGFTSDLSDFQLRFAKLFGVEIEPVKLLQILPANEIGQDLPEPKPKTQAIKKGARPLPSDQTPWGIETIYNSPLITKASGGLDVVIAILDTGVNVDHLDLKGRIAQCKDFTGRSAVIDGKCIDRNGHGTHVAGITVADASQDGKGIYGVAPEAKIAAYKVCGDNGACYADDVAAGMRMAADQGVHIINLSLGSDTESGLIREAVSYVATKDSLMVAAAGNDGPFDASIDFPAAYPEVIAVGALNKALNVTDWSSRGINTKTKPYIVEDKDIEFAAPGEGIESTAKSGGYVSLSGTSMASPFISGLAAKYWQKDAENPVQATRDFLHQLANDLNPTGDDNASGFGLPQVR